MTIRLSPLNHRWQLADMTRYRTAVEVGTHRGVFAEELARVRGPGGKLVCIDPWGSYPGDHLLADRGASRDDDRREAHRLLAPYTRAGRVEIIRDASPGAAARFADGSLCLAYMDGSHERHDVAEDLAAWWPKVRPGGFLAGHDFVTPGETFNDGVQAAVLEFAAARALDVFLIPENSPETAGQPWSFYLEKR